MDTSEDSKGLSRERYSRFARRYVDSPTHAKGVDLDRLVQLAAPQPDWRMLDVATGGGHTALKFAPLVGQVIASDLTEKMLSAAREFIQGQGVVNLKYSLGDAEALPFASESFDLVTCRIAPHHFPNPFHFAQEAARVTKTAGLVLVQDHLLPDDPVAGHSVDDFERRRDPSHRRAFNRREWLAIFAAAGLDVLHTEVFVKRHDFISWAERQSCPPELMAELQGMLAEMPQAALDWLQPQHWGTLQASFANQHLIIVGRKNKGLS